MTITVLSDNISCGSLEGEWGLSFYIEYKGGIYLLDTGASDKFISNASALGTDIADVDAAVLSHAHYDHSSGMRAFFAINGKADFYVSRDAGEDCYAGWRFISRYIGIPKGILTEFGGRIKRTSAVTEIADGVFTLAHSTPGLDRTGRRSHMYVRCGLLWKVDDFSHEQSLIFRTENGIVIFNSCSHSGPGVIVDEVRRAFPGENIYAYIGGLHLYRLNEAQIRKVAGIIRETGVKRIYTGHCTGDRAYGILREELADTIEQFRCGMKINL